MKQLFIIVALASTMYVNAQGKFEGAMARGIEMMLSAKDANNKNEAAAFFERVGDAEKNQWLPYYYAALIKTRMAMDKQGGDPDKVASEAADLITKAEKIEINSETYCIRNMIGTAQMLVDPMSRWQQYGPICEKALQDAMQKDPSNPRPYMLQAMTLKNTPEQFGGGCGVAKPLAEKAVTLYANFKQASPFHPTWGKESAESVVKGCK
jgi:hypothetical protein